MKSKVAAVIVLLLLTFVWAPAEAQWTLVVDIEARSPDGEVLATQTVQRSECQSDGQGGCTLTWNWASEAFPIHTQEWYYPRFVLDNAFEVPVAVVPHGCDIDRIFCATRTDAEVIAPSSDCISALFRECGVQQDARGFYSNGEIVGGEEVRSASWYEPLAAEWYDSCPLPPPTLTPWPTPPTYTPEPTLTPNPTPTCRSTWTPIPTDTPYPTSTPRPTATAYPEQPPF